jgi:hypothetical protein
VIIKYYGERYIMAGDQFKTVITSDEDIADLKQIISDRIAQSIDFYAIPMTDVDYIEVRFRRVNLNLLSDIKLDPIVNSFYKSNYDVEHLTKRSKIPVSIQPLQIPLYRGFDENKNINVIGLDVGGGNSNFLDKLKVFSNTIVDSRKYGFTLPFDDA